MILDSLDQSDLYLSLHPGFAAAFAFLKQATAGQAPALGRHAIDGDQVFALVQRYTTKPYAETQLESHRRYIDIQYLLRGREHIYWAQVPTLPKVTQPYDTATDAALYAVVAEGLPLPLVAGRYAILYPADGHAPACAWGEPTEVDKIVVKVKL